MRNCYKTTTRKTSCLYLNREKRPDASLAEEDIKHAGSSGRLSKLRWPAGWRQRGAEGVLPASLGKGGFREQCSLPGEGHHGLNCRRQGTEWTIAALFIPAFEDIRGKPSKSVLTAVRAAMRCLGTQGTYHICILPSVLPPLLLGSFQLLPPTSSCPSQTSSGTCRYAKSS